MDTMIRDLINADHDARNEVEKYEQERLQTRALVEAQKTEIFQSHNEIANKRLQEHIKELEKEIEDTKRIKAEEYTRVLALLQENYQSNKDGWVHDIVEQCLKG